MTTAATVPDLPKWHEFMIPALRLMQDGRTYSARDLYGPLSQDFGLSEEQLALTLASGQSQFMNRVLWATSALGQTGAIERPHRGHYVITDVGHDALKRFPHGMRRSDLFAFPEWARHEELRVSRREQRTNEASEPVEPTAALTEAEETPEDRISSGVQEIHETVADELLQRLQNGTPDFFEDAVVKLLVAMDYGGAEQRGVRVGGTADGGIDGFVDQDPLGLERVYVQAKRYQTGSGIGRETVQAFIGALHGRGANKGVFITTSHFTRNAMDYSASIPTRVVLIDGQRLTSLMIKYRVGVQVESTYSVVAVDEDFFE